MSVKVKCPEYGVSEYSKLVKPPLAFIWYDRASDVYEPIIYVEGISKKDKKDKQQFMVLTTYHESDAKFPIIDKSVQESLSDFIKLNDDTEHGFTDGLHNFIATSGSNGVTLNISINNNSDNTYTITITITKLSGDKVSTIIMNKNDTITELSQKIHKLPELNSKFHFLSYGDKSISPYEGVITLEELYNSTNQTAGYYYNKYKKYKYKYLNKKN
jgi:hypothetical protein